MRSLRVSIVTFGCRVNQYESAMMRDRLQSTHALTDEEPDVVILNACTVTALAERKARQAARRVRRQHPGAAIVVIGCLADAVNQDLTAFPGVDLLAGNNWKLHIEDVVRLADSGERGALGAAPFPQLSEERTSGPHGRVRAFLKIQDGCNRACTYCRTTQVRGPARSKPLRCVLAEARDLVDAGFPEIVLTGIDLAQYGPPDGGLPQAVAALGSLPGLLRLRIASVNPSGITSALLDACLAHDTVCPHFHVPLQSGDDSILAAMERGYDVGTYLAAIEKIRRRIPHATFGTDLIVGFPGEDDAAFAHTRRVVETVGYANLHVFRYSPRRGTVAPSLPDPVHGGVKHARSESLIAQWQEGLGRTLDNRIGSTQDVLVEDRRGNVLCGYTHDYLYTKFRSNREIPVGSNVPVRITARQGATLEGVDDHRIDAR